jgi:hypothetical protein
VRYTVTVTEDDFVRLRVLKRYTEFSELREALGKDAAGLPFPGKLGQAQMDQLLGKMDGKGVSSRRAQLDEFLVGLQQRQLAPASRHHLRVFLGVLETDWSAISNAIARVYHVDCSDENETDSFTISKSAELSDAMQRRGELKRIVAASGWEHPSDGKCGHA